MSLKEFECMIILMFHNTTILWWRIDRWIFAVHSLSRFPWWVFVPRYIVMRKLQCNFVPVFVKLVFFLHFFSFLQSARQQRIQFFNLTRHWLKTSYKQVNEPLTTWFTLIIFPEVVHIPLGPVIWVEWAHEDEISIYFSIRFIGRIIWHDNQGLVVKASQRSQQPTFFFIWDSIFSGNFL